MQQLRIDIHNCDSYIYGLVPPATFLKLREELSYRVQNCEFSEKYNTIDPETNQRKWDGRIYLIYKLKNSIRFSTGLLSKVRKILDDDGVTYDVTDSRPKYQRDMPLDWSPDHQLRDYQSEAVELFCKRGRGIIKLATGGGKTIVAAGIIQKLGVSPTLFLAMSGDLILQAKEELAKFLRINGTSPVIGQIGGGICDIRDINVCTVQSLCTAFDVKYIKADEEDEEIEEVCSEVIQKKNDIRNLVSKTKCILFDEVQHAACDTVKEIMKKALMAKYRCGLSVFPDNYIELSGNIFKNGTFISIEDAWNLYSQKNKIKIENNYEIMDLIDVYGRGWDGTGFTWKYANKIIRHKNTNEIYKISFAGKDNIKITSDHSVFCVRDDEIISIQSKDLCVGDILLIDNGRNFDTCDAAVDLSDYLKNIIKKQNCYEKIIPNDILFSSESTRRKVLEGMIDSDGSRKRTKADILRNKKPISYTTSSEKLKKCFCLLLRSLNIQYTVSERDPSTGGIVNGRRIVSSNKSWQILFSGNSLYGINEGCKGNRKRTKFNCIEKKILKIEKESSYDGYVYDLEMDGHPSFVANGVLVHNSASPWRDDGADLFIDSQFGREVVDISASDLIKKGYLVKAYINLIKIKTDEGRFSNYPTIYKNFVVNNAIRNRCIAHLAKKHEKLGDTVLILVRQINHGKLLESLIPDSVFISGVINVKKRKQVLDDMRNNKTKIVISTALFDEGIDVRRLNCLILGGSGRSSTRALQRIGRALRPFEGKTKATIYDFMDSAKYLSTHSRARKRIYKTEDEFIIKEMEMEDLFHEYNDGIWEPI